MVSAEFTSSRSKLSRAKEHLDILYQEITRWKQSEPCVVFKEPNADAGDYSWWAEIVKATPLIRWSLITGDIVHNLRSSLDNMVWELAVLKSGPAPPRPKIIQFPIADDPDGFRSELYRIAALSAEAQARIERAQPYNRKHPELPPLLGLVRDFKNLDKHRLLNVVVANVQQGRISFTYSWTRVPDEITPSYDLGPIEGRTKVAALSVRPPQPDMDCEYKGSVVISIGHPAGPSGRIRGELYHILTLAFDEVYEVFQDITF